MPENRAHAATGGRIAVGSERNRRTVDSNGDRKAVSRLLIVACVALFWLTAVFGRLGYLQLFRHSEYMARAQRQQQRVIEITPKRDWAWHVLGFVDLDEKGLGGIEYELDGQIRGKSEKIIVMADARQRWFDGGEARREPGANVILTLDEKIQYIAERELAAAIARTHAMAGTVMVMNPNTGEILGLANWPKFNPSAVNETPAEARMNRAVTALYEPGSTFKLITLAAAFDQGITRPGEGFDCEDGAVYVGGD